MKTWGAIIALALLCWSPSSATAALDDVHGFLIPGTRSPVVIGGESFTALKLTLAGTLDASFGDAGVGRVRFPGVAAFRADAGTAQPDGKIVLTGYVAEYGGTLGAEFPRHVAVARLLPTGHPDRSFGGGDGMVVLERGGRGSEVAALRDGGILVAGMTGRRLPMVLRLRPNGTLDRGFGGAGMVVVPARNDEGSVREGSVTDFVVRPNGGFVASVYGRFAESGSMSSVLARYGPRGRLDSRFGRAGLLPFHAPFLLSEVYALEPGPGGTVLAASATRKSPIQLGLAAIRGDGRLEVSYGTRGVAFGTVVPWLGFDIDLAAGPGGTAYAAVPFGRISQDVALSAFSPAGLLDGDAWSPGTTFPGKAPFSVEVRPSGDILVLASDLVGSGMPVRLVLVRISHGLGQGRQGVPTVD